MKKLLNYYLNKKEMIYITIYQKAIKLRKYCEDRECCIGCKYFSECLGSKIILFGVVDERLLTVAKAIQKEKWKVK